VSLEDADHSAISSEVGFLGLSGVGKSSLLNALLSPGTQLLPAGGVGPLTGIPIFIVGSSKRELTIRYGTKRWIHDALSALQGNRRIGSDALGRLSLLCTADQYADRDPDWLLDAIRYALHPDVASVPAGDTHTLEVLHGLNEVLAHAGRTISVRADADLPAFFRAVRSHTSGQFAPLCEHITLGWPAGLLQESITLVDLPGLGAANDAHASHARAWLERGSNVVLIVDRAGLPESLWLALRDSGFLCRWLDGTAELTIAITKLDLIADDARRAVSTSAWSTHYFDACRRATTQMRLQLAASLARMSLDDLEVQQVSSRVRIVPVSSRERHRLQQSDDAERAKVRSPESTGIPDLERAIRATSRLNHPVARKLDTALRTQHIDLRHDWNSILELGGTP
jgi:GTP-binding protein EngB required for normal cell division